jgi:hypothetical protein
MHSSVRTDLVERIRLRVANIHAGAANEFVDPVLEILRSLIRLG